MDKQEFENLVWNDQRGALHELAAQNAALAAKVEALEATVAELIEARIAAA